MRVKQKILSYGIYNCRVDNCRDHHDDPIYYQKSL